jgi:glycerol-3-phosphate acyltransferase PlsY
MVPALALAPILGAQRAGARRPDPPSGGTPAWRATLAIPAGFLAGAIPFSNLAARLTRGVDLRRVGSGTVSGTGLFEVAGFGPLAAAGILEVAKGAVGPAVAGRQRPVIAALAAGAAVAGHNWSPWLGGSGGRGISPSIGALLVAAPAGAALLVAGLAGGRLAGETAIGCLVADALLIPTAARAHGRAGALAATAVVAPMLAKRLAGNGPPARPGLATYASRLLLDRDEARAQRQGASR